MPPTLPPAPDGRVWWAVPFEKAVPEQAVTSLLNVAEDCGRRGYQRLYMPSNRTDATRNHLVAGFLELARPGDVLVFLDNDHLHPAEIVERLAGLARAGSPLVSALTFRRMTPTTTSAPDALLWRFTHNFELIRDWERGALVECDFAGFGAVAIRQEVFAALEVHGYRAPFFRYLYHDDLPRNHPTEDFYFAHCCRDAGLPWLCDTGLITPHLTWNIVDLETFDAFPWAEYFALPETRLA